MEISKNYLSVKKKFQPLLCTQIKKKIKPKSKNVILYKPRSEIKGSIACHLGEVHLKKNSKAKILNYIKF